MEHCLFNGGTGRRHSQNISFFVVCCVFVLFAFVELRPKLDASLHWKVLWEKKLKIESYKSLGFGWLTYCEFCISHLCINEKRFLNKPFCQAEVYRWVHQFQTGSRLSETPPAYIMLHYIENNSRLKQDSLYSEYWECYFLKRNRIPFSLDSKRYLF